MWLSNFESPDCLQNRLFNAFACFRRLGLAEGPLGRCAVSVAPLVLHPAALASAMAPPPGPCVGSIRRQLEAADDLHSALRLSLAVMGPLTTYAALDCWVCPRMSFENKSWYGTHKICMSSVLA